MAYQGVGLVPRQLIFQIVRPQQCPLHQCPLHQGVNGKLLVSLQNGVARVFRVVLSILRRAVRGEEEGGGATELRELQRTAARTVKTR